MEEAGRAVRRGQLREALEVDAGVDGVRLAARLLDLDFQLAAEVVGDGDDGGGAADDQAGRGGDARGGADVADVAAVGGDGERRAGGEPGGQAARGGGVGVGDVRAETACRRDR